MSQRRFIAVLNIGVECKDQSLRRESRTKGGCKSIECFMGWGYNTSTPFAHLCIRVSLMSVIMYLSNAYLDIARKWKSHVRIQYTYVMYIFCGAVISIDGERCQNPDSH